MRPNTLLCSSRRHVQSSICHQRNALECFQANSSESCSEFPQHDCLIVFMMAYAHNSSGTALHASNKRCCGQSRQQARCLRAVHVSADLYVCMDLNAGQDGARVPDTVLPSPKIWSYRRPGASHGHENRATCHARLLQSPKQNQYPRTKCVLQTTYQSS